MKTKLIGAGATVAVLSAAGLGVAVADPATPSAPSSTPSSSASAGTGGQQHKAENKAGNKAGNKGGKHKQLLGRALHGEATLGGAKKTRVVDFQRGTVTKVDGSVITVKSTDGFTASYTANAETKIRKEKKQSAIGDVAVNDRVRVLGTKDGSTITLKHIADTGPKK